VEADRLSGNRLLQLIAAYEQTGDSHMLLGAYDDAQAAYLEALHLLRQLFEQHARQEPHDAASAHGEHLTQVLVRLHRQLAGVQERRADYESAFTWLGHGLNYGGKEAQLELGRCYLLAAGVYQRQGQYVRALEWAERGLQIVEQQGSRPDMAHAYYSLGGTYGKLGRTREAIDAIRTSLRLYEELNDLGGQADAHNNLANVLAVSAGRLQESAVHCQAALELKNRIGDVHGQAVLANNLGDLKRKTGDYASAIDYFRLALERFTSLDSDYGVAVIHLNMGSVSLSQGALPEARYHLEQSRLLFEQTGAEEFLTELYRTCAALALAEARHEEALDWADSSLRLAQQHEARSEEGEAHRMRSLILLALERREQALAALRQARALFAQVDNQHAVIRCLEELARITRDEAEAAAARAEAQRLCAEQQATPMDDSDQQESCTGCETLEE
jgi:tetratricopeptide (TPR) repeat protein